MKRTLEPVPELRAPEPWEHALVERTLIAEYRKKTKKKISWSGIIGVIFGAMVVCNVGLNGLEKSQLQSAVVLLLLMLFCFYLNYAARKSNIKWNQLVRQMENREYQVAAAWAFDIRSGSNESLNYGMARVRLENGRMLKGEYTLPFDFAHNIVKQNIRADQKVLLVYRPVFEGYELVPV